TRKKPHVAIRAWIRRKAVVRTRGVDARDEGERHVVLVEERDAPRRTAVGPWRDANAERGLQRLGEAAADREEQRARRRSRDRQVVALERVRRRRQRRRGREKRRGGEAQDT